MATAQPKLEAGFSHSVALKNDGTVWTWGGNGYGGLLGVGSSDWSVTVPTQVLGLSNVVDIAAGELHTLALKSDGTVWAWGYNINGQLGDGTTIDRNTPVQVVGLSGIVALTSGAQHGLALKNDGTVWAWGANYQGQLGDGTTTNRSTPVLLSGLRDITSLAAGGYHSLALSSDGRVWSWGYNSHGQLGDGSTLDNSTPTPVTGMGNVTALAGGWKHSVALKNDASLWSWGLNSNGQLGDGTTTDRYTPVQVIGLSGVAGMTAGGAGGGVHTVAVKTDGTVWSWGQNWFGQLGDGTTSNHSTPAQVYGLSGISAVAAGGSHTLALASDGTVRAWGINSSGELGDGSGTDQYRPAQISSFNLTTTGLGESDRIFNYLEAAFSQYLSPGNASSATLYGYYYRYYPATSAFIATAGGTLYYLGPVSGNQIVAIGSVADWLAVATSAGY
ncbi:MAG: RCC1 domain-containing protein [Thermodesulfobacteriota bacterium]